MNECDSRTNLQLKYTCINVQTFCYNGAPIVYDYYGIKWLRGR